MKLGKIWIIMQMAFMMITMTFVLFVPAMYCVAWFLINFVALNGLYWEALFLFPLFTFGALFICLAIVYRITFYYNDLFEWEKKLDKLELR